MIFPPEDGAEIEKSVSIVLTIFVGIIANHKRQDFGVEVRQ